MRFRASWIGIFAIVGSVVLCTSSMFDRTTPHDVPVGDSDGPEPEAVADAGSSADAVVDAPTRGSLTLDGPQFTRVDGASPTAARSEPASARPLVVSGRIVDAHTLLGIGGALLDFGGRLRRDDVVVSAEDGSFSISIRAECSRVSVSHDRYQPQSWEPPRSSAGDGESLSHDFALEPDSMRASLSIRARFSDGRPAADASFDVVGRTRLAIPLDRIAAASDAPTYLAQLSARARAESAFESIDGEFPTRLDAAGEATIVVLVPLRVRVRVETDDAVGIADVDVRCAPATVDVVLQPTWELAIELREFSGPPPASVVIQIDGNDVAAEQGADALYRARGLARSSDVRIPVRTVFDSDSSAWIVPSVRAVLPPDEGRERRIELRFDEVVARSVSGTLRDAVTYEPVDARIAIRCASGLPIPDAFAFEGRFTARLVPGAELLVLADGYEPAGLTWWGSLDELGPIGLVPSATRLDRTRRGALRGNVRCIGAAPLDSAVEIECVAIADTWRDTTFAMPRGSFEFANLPAGPYVVTARSGDQLARTRAVVDAGAPAEITLELRPREVVVIAAVDARSVALIDGVWSGIGRPEFGSELELVRGSATSVLVGAPGYATRTVELDADDALEGVIRVELEPLR